MGAARAMPTISKLGRPAMKLAGGYRVSARTHTQDSCAAPCTEGLVVT